jgi:hypothetical protein
MLTSRTRDLVSLAASLVLSLPLGGCARHQQRQTGATTIESRREPLSIRFENSAREHAHVYLVTVERQWLLGRVEPGARAMLTIPEASFQERPGFVRLAVLVGERINPQVARDPRATFTIAQPASAIVSQRWTFMHGQIVSLGLGGRPKIERR